MKSNHRANNYGEISDSPECADITRFVHGDAEEGSRQELERFDAMRCDTSRTPNFV